MSLRFRPCVGKVVSSCSWRRKRESDMRMRVDISLPCHTQRTNGICGKSGCAFIFVGLPRADEMALSSYFGCRETAKSWSNIEPATAKVKPVNFFWIITFSLCSSGFFDPVLGVLELGLVFQGTRAWTAPILNPFLWSLFFPTGSLIGYIAE